MNKIILLAFSALSFTCLHVGYAQELSRGVGLKTNEQVGASQKTTPSEEAPGTPSDSTTGERPLEKHTTSVTQHLDSPLEIQGRTIQDLKTEISRFRSELIKADMRLDDILMQNAMDITSHEQSLTRQQQAIETLQKQSALPRTILMTSTSGTEKRVENNERELKALTATLAETSKATSDLKQRIINLEEKQRSGTLAIQTELKELGARNQDRFQHLQAGSEELRSDAREAQTEDAKRIAELETQLRRQTQRGAVAALVVTSLVIGLFFRSRTQWLALKGATAFEGANAGFEVTDRDLAQEKKLIDILENQLELLQRAELPEQDHTLPLKVGDEIQRMHMRLMKIDDQPRLTKPLLKALERLEDSIRERGYELVDLLNKPYDEGMTVEPRFVSSDALAAGTKVITRVIKPQINFNGVLRQMAQVEVSIGE